MSHRSTSSSGLASTLSEAGRRWFLGSQAWIRVATEDSAGSLAAIEHLAPPGSESPWHLHHGQDELLYVIEGSVTVIVDGRRWTLGPGGCSFGPRGVPHGFRVEGATPARILLVCTPGGGFDRFVHDAGEPATGPGFPPPAAPDIPRVAELAARANHQVLGPLPR